MTLFFVVLLVLAAAAAVASVLAVVRDGYRRSSTRPCAGEPIGPSEKWGAV